MPACAPFSVSFEGSAAELVVKAKKFAESNGGRLTGDENAGRFDATVMGFSRFAGSYEIRDQNMVVTITDKPMLLTCQMIEQAVRDKLRGR